MRDKRSRLRGDGSGRGERRGTPEPRVAWREDLEVVATRCVEIVKRVPEGSRDAPPIRRAGSGVLIVAGRSLDGTVTSLSRERIAPRSGLDSTSGVRRTTETTVKLTFKQRTAIRHLGLGPWSPYQVVCSCGYKGRQRLTKAEAETAARTHWDTRHGEGARAAK